MHKALGLIPTTTEIKNDKIHVYFLFSKVHIKIIQHEHSCRRTWVGKVLRNLSLQPTFADRKKGPPYMILGTFHPWKCTFASTFPHIWHWLCLSSWAGKAWAGRTDSSEQSKPVSIQPSALGWGSGKQTSSLSPHTQTVCQEAGHTGTVNQLREEYNQMLL
jgi:hypothetical protein